jgi:hypothetical protein
LADLNINVRSSMSVTLEGRPPSSPGDWLTVLATARSANKLPPHSAQDAWQLLLLVFGLPHAALNLQLCVPDLTHANNTH